MSHRAEPSSSAAAAAALPRLAAFRTGRNEDRLNELLAFALAVEARESGGAGEASAAPLTPDQIERLRAQAGRELHDHAFRFLHNRVEEIRAEAIAEHHARIPRPLGFLRLVLANLVALGIAAGAAAWLHGHPEILARGLALIGG